MPFFKTSFGGWEVNNWAPTTIAELNVASAISATSNSAMNRLFILSSLNPIAAVFYFRCKLVKCISSSIKVCVISTRHASSLRGARLANSFTTRDREADHKTQSTVRQRHPRRKLEGRRAIIWFSGRVRYVEFATCRVDF